VVASAPKLTATGNTARPKPTPTRNPGRQPNSGGKSDLLTSALVAYALC